MEIYLASFLLVFIWSFMFVSHKKTLEYEPIMDLLLFRLAIFSLISLTFILVYCLVKKKKKIKDIINIDNRAIIIISVIALGEVYAMYLYTYLLSKKDASWVTAIVESGIVIGGLILSILLLKEKINLKRMLGILVIIIGLYLVYYT